MNTSEQAEQAGWPARLWQIALWIAPWLLSAAAILFALMLEDVPVFQRISFVVSDEISRKLRVRDKNVVLVRLDESLSKADLERLLSQATPTLVTDYHPAALGVDIEFSGDGYAALAKSFAKWSATNPDLAKRVVWAVGYQNEPHPAAVEQGGRDNSTLWGPVRRIVKDVFFHGPGSDALVCEGCSGEPGLNCKLRFTPNPVFESGPNPENYGLAIAFLDMDGVNRRSARFVCHTQSEKPLQAFHFKLVEIYCDGRSQVVTCRDLQHNKQAQTKIYSWYSAEVIDLCELVSCTGDLGARPDQISDRLDDKIVLLYSDVPANDEHMTMMGEKKGAEIVASLIENELLFGVVPSWRVSALKWTVEGLLTLFLLYLFHWHYTQHWAILIAAVLFVVYLAFLPRLATWVPDFRNYALAIILSFWIEVLLKSAWHSLIPQHSAGPS